MKPGQLKENKHQNAISRVGKNTTANRMERCAMALAKSQLDSNCEVISVISTTGEVLHISASNPDVFGFHHQDIVGRSAFDLIHPEDHHRLRRAARAVIVQPLVSRQVEFRVRRKDGQWRSTLSTISNLKTERRSGTVVVHCRPIEPGRAKRDEEHRQLAELTQANARLEDCVLALAHDFLEPLRTITMFTQLLVRKRPADAEGTRLADSIVSGVKRMSRLLEGLHEFATTRVNLGSRPVDLEYVAKEALENLIYAITVSGAVVTIGRLPIVEGDARQLSRVFQNLIGNAIKYRSAAPIEINISAKRAGTDWIVRIQDNGVGIGPEHHESIFRLLTRQHGPEIPGAGIGLAVCKTAIESMGGTIWVESQPGLGATFCFRIAAVPKVEKSLCDAGSDWHPALNLIDPKNLRERSNLGEAIKVLM